MSEQVIGVVGSSGQVACALKHAAQGRTVRVVATGRPRLDLTSPDSLDRWIAEVRPSLIVNAAAYTAVDRAESEPEAAFKLNAEGPALLAALAAERDIPLIHISTDYVFDGHKGSAYVEDDPVNPLGVYAASKVAGEMSVRGSCPRHVILRTQWVYGETGANFVKTMLRLATTQDVVRVVGDQKGAPTYAADIADAILTIAARVASGSPDRIPWGTYHLSGGGTTTWHGFAAEIFRLWAMHGAKVPRLEEIATRDYPTAARRPANSILDNTKIAATFGIALPPWQGQLALCLANLAAQRAHGAHP